ncbi:hypothetical protein [Treponema primitia]|uniref:hypothetical protein n=1 Tax=Treponema primitia TaxID=88058 RepID=UPI0002E90B36|nr:hypothetical protein [Treponema primitia]
MKLAAQEGIGKRPGFLPELPAPALTGKLPGDIPALAGKPPGKLSVPASAGELPTELSVPTSAGKLPPELSVPTSTGDLPAEPGALKRLILTLGLPQDTLSSSLLSFFKFFSLPMDTKLIQQLRQEILFLKNRLPRKEGDLKTREFPRSTALAAAAAADKGLTLSTEALERYTAAYDDGEKGDSHHSGEGEDGAGQFRDLADRVEAETPLLGLLNRARGRDGKRWVTLPFSFTAEGVEFKVSLRIVLTDTNTIPWKASRLFLDIYSERRRWAFMLENPGGKGSRAVVGIFPSLEPGRGISLEKELLTLLGPLAEQVTLRDIGEGFLFEEDDLDMSLSVVNEEV